MSTRTSQPLRAARKPSAVRRMLWMLLAAGFLFGGVFAIKWFIAKGTNDFFDNMQPPPATISDAEAKEAVWTESADAVGSLQAVNGTQVTTEAGGVVADIRFQSGARVAKGDVLLTLNTSTETATLQSLEAASQLAQTQRDRFRELYQDKQLVSRAELDQRESDAASTRAQADAQRALIAQKTIRAPFSGVLGIRKVNLGQYLNPGDAIVGLQSLDPIHLNFSLPEQRLTQVREGQKITVSIDAMPGRQFEGVINAVEPEVDASTRNFQVQATLANADQTLRPGTFAKVSLPLGEERKVVLVPQTAINFSPYGNSVYVVEPAPAPKAGAAAAAPATDGKQAPPALIVKQRFVRTGGTRGDLIAVVDGLKPGERVATSGLVKLRNDASVIVNNKVAPADEAAPKPDNS
jgi:membrane fusion protein (multidrug efflux system)